MKMHNVIQISIQPMERGGDMVNVEALIEEGRDGSVTFQTSAVPPDNHIMTSF